MTTTDLPYDAVIDILSRLPVKTLLRLRCVCKSWCATITHPSFIATHLNRASSYSDAYLQYMRLESSQKILQFIRCDPYSSNEVRLEFPFQFKFSIASVGTVDGLICLSTDRRNGDLVLWNPSIRKFKTLPSSSIASQFFIYNPAFAGFGFHHRTNDYKVVRILYFFEDGVEVHPQVEVYTLSTDSWRRIEAVVPCFPNNLHAIAFDAFVNGSVHCVASKSLVDKRSLMIMSFDVGDEVFREMMMPNYYLEGFASRWAPILSLAVLKESLSLLVSFHDCDIWVMREYGVTESWTKQFTVVVPDQIVRKPLGFSKNNELLLEMRGRIQKRDRVLFSYDLDSRQLKSLGSCGSEYTINLIPFKETLVLPEGGNALLGQDNSFDGISSERICSGKRKSRWGAFIL